MFGERGERHAFRGGGGRSELATPELCGHYATTGALTPWSAEHGEAAPIAEAGFTVSGSCSSSAAARPFAPAFEAGTAEPTAGAYSPLEITVSRNDGEQELTHLDFTLPEGLTGKVAETVPDAPISSFGLTLPEGPHSALSANLPTKDHFRYCGQQLDMAMRLVGQNGATREQQTKVSIDGCKRALRVLSDKAGGRAVRLTVEVPSAGKLVASGSGLERASVKAGKAGEVTLRVKLTHAERALISARDRRAVKLKIGLRFKPAHGKTLERKLEMSIR